MQIYICNLSRDKNLITLPYLVGFSYITEKMVCITKFSASASALIIALAEYHTILTTMFLVGLCMFRQINLQYHAKQ